MSLLSASIERIWHFYSQWDSRIQSMIQAADPADPADHDDTVVLGDPPDLVVISSLSERAPDGQMPYKTSISGTIERDGNGEHILWKENTILDTDLKSQVDKMTKRLLVIDRGLLAAQPQFDTHQTEHRGIEDHRRNIAVLIARLHGYKGPDLNAGVIDQLYDLSIKVASAKSSRKPDDLHSALKDLVEEHKTKEEFAAFLPILEGKLIEEDAPRFSGPDPLLNAVNRAYEALRATWPR